MVAENYRKYMTLCATGWSLAAMFSSQASLLPCSASLYCFIYVDNVDLFMELGKTTLMGHKEWAGMKFHLNVAN
ncbi:hypothetical protein U1Q18_012550 [Sarracenia purpurea var. burkii]